MEKIIPSFLMLHRYCPLPGIGTLLLTEKPAGTVLGEQHLTAPVPHIELLGTERDDSDFVGFIAGKQQTSREDAGNILTNFCNSIKEMEVYREKSIAYTGRFHIGADGKLLFKPFELPSAFFPNVAAERVIRKDAIHQVRVGDTETTNVAMAAFYNETGSEKRNFWWIAAMLLGVAAIATIVLYISAPESLHSFGNSSKISLSNQPIQTYKIPN